MKKLLSVILAMMMALSFSACSNDNAQVDDVEGAADEGASTEVAKIDFPLKDMYDANQSEVLIKKHDAINMHQDYIDVDGTVFKTVDIKIVSDEGVLSGEEKDSIITEDATKDTYMNWFMEKDGCGYKYVDDKGILAAFVYPKVDYEWAVGLNWNSIFYYSEAYEWAVEKTEENGQTVLKTRYESVDDGKYYDGFYYLNADYEITKFDRVYYKATGEESFTISSTFTDEVSLDEFEKVAYDSCLSGDLCEYTMTLILDASGDYVEDHTFDISQDSSVFVSARGINFAYYEDKELSKSVGTMPPSGKKVHYWAKSTDEENNSYVEGLDAALVEGNQ